MQEEHHYTATQYAYQPLANIKRRDEMKKKLADQQGITLIVVPPWWDGETARYNLPQVFFVNLLI